jgi:phenylacetate-CoA ligase
MNYSAAELRGILLIKKNGCILNNQIISFLKRQKIVTAEKIARFSVTNLLNNIQKTQWFSHERMKDLQFAKFESIITHAYNNIPFYKEKMGEQGVEPKDIKSLEDIKKLPVVSKKDFRNASIDRIVAIKLPSSTLIRQSTSGSTGNPFIFYESRDSIAHKYAHDFRSCEWWGWKPGDKFIDIWEITGAKKGSSLKKQFFHYFNHFVYKRTRIGVEYFETKNSTIEQIKKINGIRPKLIKSLVSPMMQIAEVVSAEGLSFPKVPILTTGEMLSVKQRKFIESALRTRVGDWYGLGECRSVAYECPEYKSLHICNEGCIVEVLINGKSECEKVGDIVITDLDNYVMPFIRYKTGDLGSLSSEPCRCGRGLSVIKTLKGRKSDNVITPSGKTITSYRFTQNLGHDTKNIAQWQVIQKETNKLVVKIVPKKTDKNKIKLEITKKIKSIVNDEMEVEVNFVEKISKTQTGKMQIVISKIQ